MRVDEHTIEVAGAPVFYRSAAAPGVPTLYLHGAPTSSDDFIAFLERTGGIAPDLPGFGRTTKAGHLDYSIVGHADFVERFLDHLGVRRVTLVLHDWGAGGGLVFAQRHPHRVERLVLCNALPLLEDYRWHRLGRWLRRPVAGELLMGATNRWVLARLLRSGCVGEHAWPDSSLTAVWQQFDQGTQRAILRLHRSADEHRLTEAGAGLGELSQPSLVLWGEGDPWLGAELGAAYAARLPGAVFERIPAAGHWPWLDQPQLIERIADFLVGA